VWAIIWQVVPGELQWAIEALRYISQGTCDICANKTSVTEPRDYGHVVRDWKWRYEVDCKRSQ
jgi:hypothetical protein